MTKKISNEHGYNSGLYKLFSKVNDKVYFGKYVSYMYIGTMILMLCKTQIDIFEYTMNHKIYVLSVFFLKSNDTDITTIYSYLL